ncbi:ATP-binding cassette, subfamily B [Actinokineospora alba]|uniref:ATP-binding cassette, subfamily B n=1 Tax=Actinokineospora alba TaxID=504798 RepID=A0A1H0SA32_9PSEU|nr:ABC transporter ATP-binding protein [Actinokineospora alba]TDP66690.1 ATP-binding cassette subfamily B protein [Actinokineospora alba]SDI51828.1 ATP-binding cassette, subfamily B [Actinokineospora alba]SDP38610.1 ATP-binding cassette, subfamily B [Actinokineospora alba]
MDTERHGTRVWVLLRLVPYLRPVRGRMIGSGVAVLGSMVCGLTIPLVILRILDGPVAARDTAALPWLVLAVAALGTTEAILFYVRRKLIVRPSTQVEAQLRMDLYQHLQRLPIAFHDRWQSGQLLSRAVSDLSTLRRYIAFGVVFLVVNTLTLLAGLTVLFVLSPTLGLITLICTAPLVLISTQYESKYSVLSRRSQDQAGDLATTVEESVLGIRVLKAFGRGRHLAERFAAEAKELRKTELHKIRVLAILWAAIIMLPELGIGAMLLFGATGVVEGSMTVGTLVAGITVATYLRWPTDSIGWLLAETNDAATACERYWEVRDAEITVTDPAEPKRLPAAGVGSLRFEGVHFRYPGAERDTLRGIDLDVRPGETIALVGSTGSGKTTLTALVPRLADVTAGRVTIDGVDVRDLTLDDLRTAVATAFEEPVLFSASVRENVALGAEDVTDAQVREALRIAQAEEFVDNLPWGLDTRIGEQGLSLSGGQRQRLALARAVVGGPQVLVLDDPLSALDVHTEAEVEHALRSVLKDVTALVVAHRPSTVQLADRVAMLDGGRIVAVGEHSDLLANNEDYRALLSTMDREEVST